MVRFFVALSLTVHKLTRDFAIAKSRRRHSSVQGVLHGVIIAQTLSIKGATHKHESVRGKKIIKDEIYSISSFILCFLIFAIMPFYFLLKVL